MPLDALRAICWAVRPMSATIHWSSPQAGDVLLVLDNSGDRIIAAQAAGLYTHYRNRGVAVYFTVYDLLPVRLPQYFPPGSDRNFEKWLRVLLKMDGAVCISQTVADDFCNWARV